MAKGMVSVNHACYFVLLEFVFFTAAGEVYDAEMLQ